jgi:hypothetical protein
MTMDVTRIDWGDPASKARYDRLFASCPHAFIQQSTSWAEAIGALGPDEPIFLVADDGGTDLAALPLYLYRHEQGNVLTSVPQPGPLGGVFCLGGIDAESRRRAYGALLEAAEQVARDSQCLTLTLITNPIDDDFALYEEHFRPDFVLDNFTQLIPLDEVFEGDRIVLRDYVRHSNLSRNVKKGNKAGFDVRFCESRAQLHAWYATHAQRHREIGGTPLELRLFERLFDVLAPRDQAALLTVEKDGEVASGVFLVYHKQVMDMFMLSMDSRFASQAPSYVSIDRSLKWARQLGMKVYNWQSCHGRDGGVYRFKKTWGGVERPYYFVTRMFCRPERLIRLGGEGVARHYRGHYVVPFTAFERHLAPGHFCKV